MAIKDYLINNKKFSVEVLEQLPSYFKLKINDKFFEISIEKYVPQEQLLNIIINNQPIKIKYLTNKKQNHEDFLIFIINQCTQVYIEQLKSSSESQKTRSSSAFENCKSVNDSTTLRSPLAGRITKVLVQEGDCINPEQTLLIIESMKMENEIRATFDGIIKNILISEGNLVQQNQELINFQKKGDINDSPKHTNKKKF